MKNRTRQSGNMFVYILGAIFLLGILIVVMKGSFQEGSGIDGEKTAMTVGQVQRYAAELERGVNYVLRNGYSETDIRFAHPNANVAYGLITDIPARQVFDPTGGGVEWKNPPTGVQQFASPWYFTGNSAITGVGTTCNTGVCSDLIAFLPFVTKSFCLSVNMANNTTNPLGDAPVDADNFSWATTFTGAFSGGSLGDLINATGGYTDGKMEGCIKYSGTYYYYRVLLAR